MAKATSYKQHLFEVDGDSDDEPPEKADEVVRNISQQIRKTQLRREQDRADARLNQIPGNMYWFLAFRGTLMSMNLIKSHKRNRCVFLSGCFFAGLVQLLGPPAVLAWGVNAMSSSMPTAVFPTFPGDFVYHFGSQEYGTSNLTKRIMSVMFIILFLLNAIYEVHRSMKLSKTIEKLAAVLSHPHIDHALSEGLDEIDLHDEYDEVQPPIRFWLYWHCFINSWVLIFSGLALLPLFWVSENPRDVILDAFGLAIIYRIDNAGADLGFINEEWPAEFMGQLCTSIKARDMETDQYEPRQWRALSCLSWCCRPYRALQVTEGILWVLLVTLPFIFIFAAGLRWNEEVWQGEMTDVIGKLWAQQYPTVPLPVQ